MKIESAQNPRVKYMLQLQQKARARKQSQQFVVEGTREVERAIASGFCLEEIWATDFSAISLPIPQEAKRQECSTQVFEKLSYRGKAAAVVGVFKTKSLGLAELNLPKNPLLIIVQAIEKPGNVGAVLRTADALGVDAVIHCDSVVDLYNPNVLRNSLGGFFHMPQAAASTSELIQFLKDRNIQIVTTHLESSKNYLDVNYTKPTAIVMGSEANGVTDEWVKNTSEKVIIPMQGIVDSLNISVATAICAAEAIRQRM